MYKLRFSSQDKGMGVVINVDDAATPKRVAAIGRLYAKKGWQPSPKTKKILVRAERYLCKKERFE